MKEQKLPIISTSPFSSSSEDVPFSPVFKKKVFAPPVDCLVFSPSSSSSSSSLVSNDSSSSYFASETDCVDQSRFNACFDDCVRSNKLEFESSEVWFKSRISSQKKRQKER